MISAALRPSSATATLPKRAVSKLATFVPRTWLRIGFKPDGTWAPYSTALFEIRSSAWPKFSLRSALIAVTAAFKSWTTTASASVPSAAATAAS